MNPITISVIKIDIEGMESDILDGADKDNIRA